MPNRRGRTLTKAERASSNKAASSERSGCMSIYTSEIMEGVAVSCAIPKRYDLSRRSHSAPVVRHDNLRKRGEPHPLLAKLVDLLRASMNAIVLSAEPGLADVIPVPKMIE